ncbi:MAG: hypothetical protein J5746_12145 [Victivallales bacterium]|nr:hypothetical protein [Victivallales bacterium]
MELSQGDGRHRARMSVATNAYYAGYTDYDSLLDVLEKVCKNNVERNGGEVDHADCENTAKHVIQQAENGDDEWRGNCREDSPAQLKRIQQAELAQWKKYVASMMDSGAPESYAAIMQHTTDNQLDGDFRKALGLIWTDPDAVYHVGALNGELDMLGTWCRDDIAESALNYLDTHMTFNPLGDKKGDHGYTSKKDNNVRSIDWLLLEMDEPLTETKATPKTWEWYDEVFGQQAQYWNHIKELGELPIGAIIYSGGKSIHVLVAVKATVSELRDRKPALRRLFTSLHLDTANLDGGARHVRIPNGIRRFIRNEDGTLADIGAMVIEGKISRRDVWHIPDSDILERRQLCLYIADSMEHISLEDLEGRLHKIVSSFAPAIPLPMCRIPIKDKDGKDTGKFNVEYDCLKWRPFLKAAGVSLVEYMPKAYSIMITDEMGVSRLVEPIDALNHLYKCIYDRDPELADRFHAARCKTLASKDLAQYALAKHDFRPPRDTREAVLVPFANGMLEITRDGAMLHDDYMEYDVLLDGEGPKQQALAREWREADGKGEFETFVERACGSEENSPVWQDRKKAIMSLLGYLVSQHKEAVNYLCVITEETMTENDGGTGKSIILKAPGYWRRRFEIGKKVMNDTPRFMFSGIKGTLPDYIHFDDAPARFDYTQFFTMTTSGIEIEHKGQDIQMICMEAAPKFCLATNYYPRGVGNSFQRRLKLYEISNHYGKHDGKEISPYTEFGHSLYDDWDDEEWARFDGFMTRCVKQYICEGLLEYRGENTIEKQIAVNIPADMVEFYDDFTESHGNGIFVENSDLEKAWTNWKSGGQHSMCANWSVHALKRYLQDYCRIAGVKYTEETKTRKIKGKVVRGFYLETAQKQADETPAEMPEANTPKTKPTMYMDGIGYVPIIE